MARKIGNIVIETLAELGIEYGVSHNGHEEGESTSINVPGISLTKTDTISTKLGGPLLNRYGVPLIPTIWCPPNSNHYVRKYGKDYLA